MCTFHWIAEWQSGVVFNRHLIALSDTCAGAFSFVKSFGSTVALHATQCSAPNGGKSHSYSSYILIFTLTTAVPDSKWTRASNRVTFKLALRGLVSPSAWLALSSSRADRSWGHLWSFAGPRYWSLKISTVSTGRSRIAPWARWRNLGAFLALLSQTGSPCHRHYSTRSVVSRLHAHCKL